jgi:hypothetical protein
VPPPPLPQDHEQAVEEWIEKAQSSVSSAATDPDHVAVTVAALAAVATPFHNWRVCTPSLLTVMAEPESHVTLELLRPVQVIESELTLVTNSTTSPTFAGVMLSVDVPRPYAVTGANPTESAIRA